jgi:hypothetical protein
VGYNLGAIVAIVVMIGVALAYVVDAAARSHRAIGGASGAATYERTLGGRDLTIPAAWFRHPEQRDEGFAKRIDLRFALHLDASGPTFPIDVTLLPRSGVRPSARLLDGVYLHMFEDGELAGPHGLIGKSMNATGGYAGETVWYDPLSADPFVAKCSAAIAPGGEPRCLRTVYLAPGIAAIYAFDFRMLGQWRAFDTAIQPWLEQIGAFR